MDKIPEPQNKKYRSGIRYKTFLAASVFLLFAIIAVAQHVFTEPPVGICDANGCRFGNTSQDANNYTADIIKGKNVVVNNSGTNISGAFQVKNGDNGRLFIMTLYNTSDGQNVLKLYPPQDGNRTVIEMWGNASDSVSNPRALAIEAHSINDVYDPTHNHVSFYTINQNGDFVHVIDWLWGTQYDQTVMFNSTIRADKGINVIGGAINVTGGGGINLTNQEIKVVGGQIHENSSVVDSILVESDTGAVSASKYMKVNNRARFGYNGTSASVEISDNDGNKAISFRTNKNTALTLGTTGFLNMSTAGKGITLTSANGTAYCITVSNAGVLTSAFGVCS